MLSYDETLICPSVETSIELKSLSGDFTATPNIALPLSRQSGVCVDPQIVFLGECAFFQSEEVLMKKLQCEVDAYPEIIMALMIILTEATPYHSPKEGSTAWHTFRHYPECILFLEFMNMMPKRNGDSEVLGPVTVADHPWSRIAHIDHYVWVKDGEEKFNISQHHSSTTTHGTLFPKIDMQAVDTVIHDGLSKIKDAIVHFSLQLNPNANVKPLEDADLQWNFSWRKCQLSIENTAECTAHKQFQWWYVDTFRGKKQLIEDIDGGYIDM